MGWRLLMLALVLHQGLGPTALHGIHGTYRKNSWTPADIAGAVETAKATDTDSGTEQVVSREELSNLGLTADSYNISADNIRHASRC